MLQQLKKLITETGTGLTFRSQREVIPFSLYENGIPRGALSEWVGPGKTEALARFLAENPTLRVAWIEDELTIYPPALFQRNANLNQILFIEAGQDLLWSTLQVTRSGLFDLIILSGASLRDFFTKDSELRKIQIAIERAQALCILLQDLPSSSFAISLQLKFSGTLEPLKTLKQRRA